MIVYIWGVGVDVSGDRATYVFFFQAEDGIRDLVRSRGLGDVYKRQVHRLGRDHRPVPLCRSLQRHERQRQPDWLVGLRVLSLIHI